MERPQQLLEPVGAGDLEAVLAPAGAAPARARIWKALAPLTIVALAGVLRLWMIEHNAQNPFYDAAVRSMGLSWHNFFFGSFDPQGSLAIDKPPLDLWLQVISTKLLSFNRASLSLPEALGGTAAVALLYGAVRRACGGLAGATAALALAVMPVAVLTSRSDTMDSVMAALVAAALFSAVVAVDTRRDRYVLASAVLMGLAFNVKLTQALIPLPAIGLLWLAAPRPGRRMRVLAGASGIFVAVAMAWVSIASLTPASQRPMPMGSRNGSIFRAVFVFNGLERLSGSGRRLAPVGFKSTPGPVRLLSGAKPGYDRLIGYELAAALVLLAVAGVAWLLTRNGADPPPGASRTGRWLTASLLVWVAVGYVLFSFMPRLEPRYLEALSVAVAACVGVGAWHQWRLLRGWLLARRWQALVLGLGALALFAVPASASVELVQRHESDANPAGSGAQYSAYLRAHRGGARYEAATAAPLAAASLIAQDAQPVLELRSVDGVLVPVRRLQRLVKEGAVRFAIVSGPCHGRYCTPAVTWTVNHATLVRPGLYRYRR